jgi:hypothetical protein
MEFGGRSACDRGRLSTLVIENVVGPHRRDDAIEQIGSASRST